jgi:hypothetical protein
MAKFTVQIMRTDRWSPDEGETVYEKAPEPCCILYADSLETAFIHTRRILRDQEDVQDEAITDSAIQSFFNTPNPNKKLPAVHFSFEDTVVFCRKYEVSIFLA